MNEISLRTDEIISQDLEHYGNMLLRLAYSYMKNMYDAEDVVQEVFVQLLKNIDIFESDDYKKHWLICVARNICGALDSAVRSQSAVCHSHKHVVCHRSGYDPSHVCAYRSGGPLAHSVCA